MQSTFGIKRPMEDDRAASRFVVGMDLGTTNSAVCYVDTEEHPRRIRSFRIPQIVSPGRIESLEVLPSFHYEAAEGEFPDDALRLPFVGEPRNYTVGLFARDHGALVPGRLIASAKSWLCHNGVDRTAPLLPWHGSPDVTRLSPVEVSSRYLLHVRQSWDAAFPNYPLSDQEFVLTIPASFDEVARQLTIKAAAVAGLDRVILIEEPQAAFYAWLYRHAHDWQTVVKPGEKILVCDIGGGTTDLTLIRVRGGADGNVRFHRIAVGDHLILGGDNFDLALAHHVEAKLAQRGTLETRQWSVLVRRCQRAKEELLGSHPPEKLTIAIPGSGSRIVGGSLQVELSREEAQRVILDGFFPFVEKDARPESRRTGFQEFGLPYANDPAVSRQIAFFLQSHREILTQDPPAQDDLDPTAPDHVLLNGGVFFAAAIRDRLMSVLARWYGNSERKWEPNLLENDRLDLAVAQGAAYYGMVRRGEGVRIAASLARSYYLGIDLPSEEKDVLESAMEARTGEPSQEKVETPRFDAAICVLAAGTEPNQEVTLTDRPFRLRVAEPVEFPVYYSGTRLTDAVGRIILAHPEQVTALPPIRTVLKAVRRAASEKEADVEIHAKLTEIGTLEMWCKRLDGPGSWRLEFDVRSAVRTEIAPHGGGAEDEGVWDEGVTEAAVSALQEYFGVGARRSPEGVVKQLVRLTGVHRYEWPASFLRRLWAGLVECEQGRRQSPSHEARWLNLLGFCLRPGYGVAADDWRVAETWRLLHGRLVHPSPMCRAEWWILWRRISGGLPTGRQRSLADPLLASVRSLQRQAATGKTGSDFPTASHEGSEIWRLLGSLELLPVDCKVELGGIILDLLPRRKTENMREAMIWTLGRLGARVPLYGPLNCVVPQETIEAWLRRLMELELAGNTAAFSIMQLARCTGDRFRDLHASLREKAAEKLETMGAPSHLIELVRTGGSLREEERKEAFGESLPRGLRVV
ncbi:Hsp70 family protein [Thermopirellula anaerolimosa]